MEGLHQRPQLLLTDMLNLNAVVQAPIAQNRHLIQKTLKSVQNRFGRPKTKVARGNWHLIKIKRQNIYYFALMLVHGKTLNEVDAARLFSPDHKEPWIDEFKGCLEPAPADQKPFLGSLHDNGWNLGRLLHAWTKKIVSWVDSSRRNSLKAAKTSKVTWQGYGIRILGRAWYFTCEERINTKYYMASLDWLSVEIEKKRSTCLRKKCSLPKTMASPAVFSISADIKKMLQRKKLSSNEEVVESKDKSLYKKGIENLWERWDEGITPKREYVDQESWILRKPKCFS